MKITAYPLKLEFDTSWEYMGTLGIMYLIWLYSQESYPIDFFYKFKKCRRKKYNRYVIVY